MSETNSKYLALVELIVIVIPMTLYCILGLVTLVPISLSTIGFSQNWMVSIAYAICVAAITSGWYLMGIFIYGGAHRLRLVPITIWVCATIGGLLSIVGVASIFYPECLSSLFSRPLSEFAGGSPMTIPLAHLYLEKRGRFGVRNLTQHPG
jgi:hypothetical protein